jgi:hypothetical protein
VANARWRVTGQTQREDLGPGGKFRTVIDITFELLDSGDTGTVTVPLANYTQEEVASVIQQRADVMYDVGRMSAS